MINVSQAIMDEFLSPAQKNLRLKFSDNTTLENADIYTETMHLEQSICSDEQLRFGSVNSACFKVQIKGTSKRYVGLKVTPYIYTTSGGITLGEFTIVNDELSDNREYRSLTAYDALNEVFEKDLSTWYTNINLPTTLREFRNSLFAALGITQESVNLPNDTMTVERTVSTTDAVLSGKKIIESICEINGRFGVMAYNQSQNRGVFRYVEIKGDDSLYPRDDLYPRNDLYPHQSNLSVCSENDILQGGLVYQEYTSLPIKQVQIRNTAHDVGATYPTNVTGNSYQITDNFLVYGKNDSDLTAVAQNFYNSVKHISYIPSKATMRGRPWQEVGDQIVINIKRTTVSFPILNRVLSGITALKDEYTAKGRENYTYNINSTKRQIEQAKQKTLEIVKSVDMLRTTMTERFTTLDGKVESHYSTFQQTAQEIRTTVEAHYTEQTQFATETTTFKSVISQRADAISSRVTATETAISDANTAISQTQSTITQTASEIRAEVRNATTHAAIVTAINDNTSSIKIQADKVDISGFVTFSDLSTAGRTTINGSNITTGELDADLIKTGKIESNNGTTYFDLDNNQVVTDNGSCQVVVSSGELQFKSKTTTGYYSVGGRVYCATQGEYNASAIMAMPMIYLSSTINSSAPRIYSSSGTLILDCNTLAIRTGGIKIGTSGQTDTYSGTFYMHDSLGRTINIFVTNGLITSVTGN